MYGTVEYLNCHGRPVAESRKNGHVAPTRDSPGYGNLASDDSESGHPGENGAESSADDTK